ncbi:hypothetical protein BDZ94DRAFT_1320523 [Collybia nuda]|uniref:Uncharacterized protein n=1 Tax=Collybia nuda TaxID=64659 RepID=A0A9P5Y9L2_9AGAR|nr:hypothetical protein BDZ94DRAFT_1320523 [Collybia nuda]
MQNPMSWITNTVKHSTESSTQMYGGPQATPIKTDQMRGPPLQSPQPGLEPPIGSRMRDPGVAVEKDIGENMGTAPLTKQRPVSTVGNKTPVQQKAPSGEKSYASMTAAPVSKRRGEDSAGIPGETKNERTSFRRMVVGGVIHSDARPRGSAQGYSGGDRRPPRLNPTELVELRKKLASCVQEKDAMTKDKDSTQRKLADAERRNRDLEEQNKRQLEQLRTITSNLRQAEDLHRQTLDLLEMRTSELKGAQAFLSKEDSLSGADLIGMVDALNAEILQVAACIVDSLESLVKVPKSNADKGSATQPKSVVNLGEPIIQTLRSGSGRAYFDPLSVQVALQVCLVGASSWLIRSWIPGIWKYDSMFSAVHADIQTVEGQAISRRWRAITCGRLKQHWKRYENDMMAFVSNEIINVLVLAGQKQSLIKGEFLSKFHDRLGIIVQSALRINEATRVDITSRDLQVIVISPEAEFNIRDMDDAFSEGGSSRKKRAVDGQSRVRRVAGTTDLGILCRDGSSPVPEILKKPKVVLVSTLREGYQKV